MDHPAETAWWEQGHQTGMRYRQHLLMYSVMYIGIMELNY